MSPEAWTEKLSPLLSVLDSIRPDAAKALREMIACEHEALRRFEMPSEMPSEMVDMHLHWGRAITLRPVAGSGWLGVKRDIIVYEERWFGHG